MKIIKVVELFAGVGVVLGLVLRKITNSLKLPGATNGSPHLKPNMPLIFMSKHLGILMDHSNVDIEAVPTSEIPDHDLIVWRFSMPRLFSSFDT